MKKGYGMLLVIFGFIIVSSLSSGAANVPKDTLANVGPTLAAQFTYEPFEPPMVDHLWMDVGTNRLSFLHFDRPVTEKGAKVIFIGDGIKGRFCAQDQPDGGKTGFVHFHALKAQSGAHHGHGGSAGIEGYWLRHVAVGSFDMMGMKFIPGTAYNFMPTEAPHCK